VPVYPFPFPYFALFLLRRPPQQTTNPARNWQMKATMTNQNALPKVAVPESTSLMRFLAVMKRTQSMMNAMRVMRAANQAAMVPMISTMM